MKIGFYLLAATVIFTQVSCKDNTDEGVNGSGNKLNASVLNIGKANPPVEANTPPAFQVSANNSGKSYQAATYDDCLAETLADLGITTNEWDDAAENRNNACKAGVDVKGRYFSQSSTELRSVLSSIDGAIEGYKDRAENSYLPCADPNNTQGGSIGSTSYNAYNLVSKSGSYTFDDGESFDMGMTYKLSCLDQMVDMNNKNFSRAFGTVDGTTYIYEGGDNARGMIAKIDSDDNVDVWLGFGSAPIEWSSDFVQTLGPAGAGELTYENTTGVAHIKSTTASNTIELTATGIGLIEGCDVHLITNDQYMFVTQNQNYYGTCYEGDDGTTGTGNIRYLGDDGEPELISFNAKIANAAYCLDVSGTDPTLTTYKNCVDVGLATCQDTPPAEGETDDGEVDLLTSSTETALQGQPVSCVGNFSLTRLNRQAIKAHNTTHLFTALHTDVETFEAFPADLPPIDGTYEEASLYMTKDRDTSTSSRVGAFCKDVPPMESNPASDTSQSINEIFTLDLATLSTTDFENLKNAKAIRLKFFVTNNDVAGRGYADYTATATVDIDGTNRGVPVTFAYDASTTEQEGEISISEYSSTLTNTSVIKITLSGTNQVKCHTDATRMTSTSVAVGLGSPKVFFYTDPSETTAGQ